jgi:ribonuclease J
VALARACQVPEAIETQNGALVRIAPGRPEIVAEVPSGRLGLDGRGLIRLDGDTLRHRHRMSFNGLIVVSVALDHDGALLADPKVSLEGLLEGESQSAAAGKLIALEVVGALEALSRASLRDDEAAAETARLAARRWYHKNHYKKPVTKVHIIRL